MDFKHFIKFFGKFFYLTDDKLQSKIKSSLINNID